MAIPSKAERIITYYGDQYKTYQEKINNEISYGSPVFTNQGNQFLRAIVTGYGWPNEELIKWLQAEYEKAGWNIFFERPKEDTHSDPSTIYVDIYEG